MTEKYYPFHSKRVLAFLYAQATQGDVHVERSGSHLTVQAPDVLFFVRWSSTYTKLFEEGGPSRVRLTEKRECLPTEVSAEGCWYSTLQQCFGEGQTVPTTVTALLGQRERYFYRKIADEQGSAQYWIPKEVTDLLAETVEELNQFFHWQLSPETGWLAGLGLQKRGSLFLRLNTLQFDDEDGERDAWQENATTPDPFFGGSEQEGATEGQQSSGEGKLQEIGGYLGPNGEAICERCTEQHALSVQNYDFLPGASGWPRYTCEQCGADF